MPNFANEMTLVGYSFFTKIDTLYLKRPHITRVLRGSVQILEQLYCLELISDHILQREKVNLIKTIQFTNVILDIAL